MRRLWSAGGTQIARGMFFYVVVMAALATLSPFDFQRVPGRGVAVMLLADDLLLNLLLLFPAGFLFMLGTGSRRPSHALWLGLALSVMLEAAQLYLPTRHTNLVDVLANGCGCWAGVLAQRRVGLWLASFVSEELVLELPLTGALYVLAPLLMLLGLSEDDSRRVWLMLPLALFGATILVALYRQRFVQVGRLPAWRFAGYCGLAFCGITLPSLREHALALCTIAACMSLAIWLALRSQTQLVAGQRRFEAATVRRGLPWFAAYLGALIALAWLDPEDTAGGQRGAFRLLEAVATLTVYGYLVSELTARLRGSRASWLIAIAVSGAVIGAVIELAPQAYGSPGVHVFRTAALAASAAAGAVLHRSQVGLVQIMRSAGRSGAPGPRPSLPPPD